MSFLRRPWIVAALLLSAVSGSLLLAEDRSSPARSVPPPNHPIFKKLDAVFDRADALAREHWAAAFLYRISTGQSASALVSHYRELFRKSAELVAFEDKNGINFGNGSSGYHAAQKLFDRGTVDAITGGFGDAFVLLRRKGSQTPWSEWCAQFATRDHPRGNPELGLLAIAARLGYSRFALAPESEARRELDAAVSRVDPIADAHLLEGYSMGSVPEKLFGIDLSAPRTIEEQNRWGRAYKSVAGILFALALRREGFEDTDIRMAIRLSTLAYEASDFLHDHVGKDASDGLFQMRDRPQFDLSAPYSALLAQIRDRLAERPELARDLQTSLTEIPLLSRVDRAAKVIDTEDDLFLTFLLIAHRSGRPDLFRDQWADLILESDRGKDLLSLFDAGSRDVSAVLEPAIIALRKMKDEPRKERATRGIHSDLAGFEKLLRFFGI
jgi:hypothetical protein